MISCLQVSLRRFLLFLLRLFLLLDDLDQSLNLRTHQITNWEVITRDESHKVFVTILALSVTRGDYWIHVTSYAQVLGINTVTSTQIHTLNCPPLITSITTFIKNKHDRTERGGVYTYTVSINTHRGVGDGLMSDSLGIRQKLQKGNFKPVSAGWGWVHGLQKYANSQLQVVV